MIAIWKYAQSFLHIATNILTKYIALHTALVHRNNIYFYTVACHVRHFKPKRLAKTSARISYAHVNTLYTQFVQHALCLPLFQQPCVAHCKQCLWSPTTAHMPQTLLPHLQHANKLPPSTPSLSMSTSIPPSSPSSRVSQSSHRGPCPLSCAYVAWYEKRDACTGGADMFQNVCSVDFWGFATVIAGWEGVKSAGVGEAWLSWRCARKSLCTVFSAHVSACHLSTLGQGVSLPWIARSSGRLSRTRLRVRFPQSLAFTRCALVKSQPFVFGVDSVSISKSILVSVPCGKCVGDCASGVERAPKLEFDVVEASSKCLRLVPIFFEEIVDLGFFLSHDTKCVLLRRWKRKGCSVVNRDD